MSDQDFFFDEEDEKPARTEKASAPKPASSKPAGTRPASGSKASAKTSAPVSSGSFFEQSLSMGVASLLVVIALLIGVIAGIFVGQQRAQDAILNGVPTVTNTGVNGGGGTAPALSQDQLNSGELPAGHPSLAATGSTNATGK